MSDDFELVRGSGDVFRDLDQPNADRQQLRAILATEIIGAMDARKLSPRKANAITGLPATDFPRYPQSSARTLHSRSSDEDPRKTRSGYRGFSYGQPRPSIQPRRLPGTMAAKAKKFVRTTISSRERRFRYVPHR